MAKTDAGVRDVDVLPVLQSILAMLPRRGPDDLVFGTSRVGVRARATSAGASWRHRSRANARLEDAGDVPVPERLTPHKRRHTFASVLVAIGCDPAYVMSQLGHADPGFTLRVYTHGMRRDPASREALRELAGAADWAATWFLHRSGLRR